MLNEIKSATSPLSTSSNSPLASNRLTQTQDAPHKVVLSPGEWIRAVSNVEAPFGFDRMPTVWG